MKKLRIGYHPLSADLSQPGDRRRIVFWARHRGHEIVTDLSQPTDVILLSEKADFGAFPKRAKGTPVVFDLVDAYLAPETFAKDWFRGTSKVLAGQLSGGPKPFTKFVENLCRRSSAVICSSPEQSVTITPFSQNVHVILDSHDEIPFANFRNKARDSKKSIFWEGMPATLGGVGQLVEAVRAVERDHNVEMIFVTNEKYFLLLGKYLERDTSELLSKILQDKKEIANIVPWSINNLVEQSKHSDLAVIPIELTNPLQYLKPENRLLIMWRLGLPCLTSASPAYRRVAEAAGVNSVCATRGEWESKMRETLESHDSAEENVTRGQVYIKEFHNKDLLLERWDRAFDSVL